MTRDWPETAEALMRSRFEAFRDADSVWLLASWHPSTRPTSIDLENNPECRRLQIVDGAESLSGRTRRVARRFVADLAAPL